MIVVSRFQFGVARQRLQPQCVFGQQASIPVTVGRVGKVGLKYFKAFCTHYARHHRNRTVFVQWFEPLQLAPGAATHDILISIYNIADIGQHQRAVAHQAGFQGHIEGAFIQVFGSQVVGS